MTAIDSIDVYVTALDVDDMFADPTYQRTLDVARARNYARTWDRRLAGILEVSDRGEGADPRYAVMDGQHRWAAAGYLQTPPSLVANVHSGLTVADEAALFDKLNRQRKQTTTWDHWKARRIAGDEQVLAIEQIVARTGLRVTEVAAADTAVSCIGTLEKVANSAGGLNLLQVTLDLLTDAYGTHQRSAFEAPLIHGAAMVVATFGDLIEGQRLVDALGEQSPKRIRVQASTMRDDGGMPGSLAKLSAVAIVNVYNQSPGKRLTWPSLWKGVLAKAPKPITTPVDLAVDIDEQAVEFVCQGTPMKLTPAEAREVVRRLDGKIDATEIARRLQTSPANVQAMRCRIGIAKPKAVAS